MRAPIDDLHVVDAEDGEPVRLRVEVGPRFEVADHCLGREVLDHREVRLNVLRDGDGSLEDVGPERSVPPELVVLIDDVEPVDRVHLPEAFAQECHRATRRHDLDFVTLAQQVIEDDPGADRVAHAFSDHAVEDAHGPKYRSSSCRTTVHPVRARDLRSWFRTRTSSVREQVFPGRVSHRCVTHYAGQHRDFRARTVRGGDVVAALPRDLGFGAADVPGGVGGAHRDDMGSR